MNEEDFETFDEATNTMRVLKGKNYQLMVGASSREQDLKTVTVKL